MKLESKMKRRVTRVPGFKMIDKWESRGAPGIDEHIPSEANSPKKSGGAKSVQASK